MQFRRRLSECYSSESDEEINYEEIPRGIRFELEHEGVKDQMMQQVFAARSGAEERP